MLDAARAFLTSSKLVDDGGLSLMEGLVRAVGGAGVPLWRVSFSLMTKHPELCWFTVQWVEGEGVRRIERQRKQLAEGYFTASPLALMQKGGGPERVRLDVDGPLRFPVCEDLRAAGGTDYFVQPLRHLSGEIGYISWA